MKSLFAAATTALTVALCFAFGGSLDATAKQNLEKEVTSRVTKMAFVPGVDFSTWPTVLAKYRKELDAASTQDEFAAVINRALAEYKQSHLALITPDQNNARKTGNRAGIGIMAEVSADGIVVRGVVKNSPSDKAGLKVGEVILQVNGVKPTDISALAGEIGTEFKLRVRSKSGEERDIKVKREIFSTVQQAVLTWPVKDSIAVLKIPTFEQTYDSKRVAGLMQDAQKAKVLIVDLRNNPGGFVFNMLHCAGLLLPEGQPIGTMVFKYGLEKFVKETGKQPTDLLGYAEWSSDKLKPLRPSAPMKPFQGQLIVLTNGGTGSAAEMLSQALKEVGAAKVVGSKSAGQVLAALITPMPSDFAMIVPIQDYVTIKGRRLEAHGVIPDIEAADSEDNGDAVLEVALRYAQTLPLN